jgi:hypothetical protein
MTLGLGVPLDFLIQERSHFMPIQIVRAGEFSAFCD